jgi:iron-sulfur cluster assembly 1
MKPIVEITNSAQHRINDILTNNPNKILKLGVNNRGCSGHSYTFDLINADDVKSFDEKVTIDQITVIIDGASIFKLLGSQLDWQVDRFGSKFVWSNPLVKNTCGCGESVGF